MFLLQTGEDDQILFDFQYELLEQIRINRWFYQNKGYDVITARSFDKFVPPKGEFVCPVGSIEFVQGYINKYCSDKENNVVHQMKPINVPIQLLGQEFTGRFVKKYVPMQDVLRIIDENKDKNFYVKSSTQIKGFSQLVYPANVIHTMTKALPTDHFDVSEDVGLLSAEWRVFIFNGKILDVRRYIGNWEDSIDPEFVKAAVEKWSLKPKACTLDIAKTADNKFIVIEGHNFVSCGTYGFSDQHLPRMFAEGFKWEIK